MSVIFTGILWGQTFSVVFYGNRDLLVLWDQFSQQIIQMTKKIWNKYLTNKHIKYVSEEVWKLYPLLNDTTKIARVATNNP